MPIDDHSAAHGMIALQGPTSDDVLDGAVADIPPFGFADGTVAGVPCLVARTGYTGERGVEIVTPADGTAAVWEHLLAARRRARAGWARATPCGSRSATRCTATTSRRPRTRSRPASGGCAPCRRTSPVPTCCAGRRRTARRERLVAFRMTERAIPRSAMAILDGDGAALGTVTSGTLSPSLDEGIGMGYVRSDHAGVGTAIVIDVRGRPREAVVAKQASVHEGVLATMSEGVYPDDLRYHREHDWVRLDGDEAIFGITWYAQDSLGEVVYFDPPEVGAQVKADEPYGELESVKAVSDVIAPLSGEVTAVNEARDREPGPGEPRSLRRGVADQGAARRRRLARRPARRGGLQGAASGVE